jgi:4'-phosphopantetheinyl transferase
MHELPGHDDWLTPPEAERLQSFRYTKRREEARLGRWTAKRAIATSLGQDPDDVALLRELVIRNASDGAPEVFVDGDPAPLRISMTDRADWAVCTVIDAQVEVGCDLELVEPRTTRFVRDWFTTAECDYVLARPDEHDLLANLIWSAKESALKVLRTGLRRDTRSVEVTLHDRDPADGWAPLSVEIDGVDVFDGWWRSFGEFVLSYACAVGTQPPNTLVDPSPLESAVPAHSWMASPRR